MVLLIAPFFVFAQSQPPCSGSATITDATQAQPGVLAVVSNSAQASFTITGPATYQGSGYYWVQQGIPAGTYTITWNSVSGCGTPSAETKTTNTRGSVAFAGNYQTTSDTTTYTPLPTGGPTPTPSSPNGHYMTINSNPTSATVYINGSMKGTAPVKIKLPENVPIQIKCTLNGYNDYTYNYPAVGPLPLNINSINSDWICTLVKKSVSPTVSYTPLPPSYQSGQNQNQTPAPTVLPTTPLITSTPYISPTPSQVQPKGFFFRIFNSITSFIGKVLGRKSSLPPASTSGNTNSQNSPSSPDSKLEGLWKVKQS